jgi:uncharacterized protein
MKLQHIVIVALVIGCTTLSAAQMVQVSRANRTISVTADESVTAEPDFAVVTLGHRNYGTTHPEAYGETVRASDQLTTTLTSAGIRREQIETGELKIDRVELDAKWDAKLRTERQFEATQTWKVRVRALDAAKIVDLAMKSGANTVEDVQWEVGDPNALQAKASGAALAKARKIAEQMAKGLGSKIGELVYASNRAAVASMLFGGGGMNTEMAYVQVSGTTRQPVLSLYPAKVKQSATVYAVFAIE